MSNHHISISNHHIVVGAGALGTVLANKLAAQGHTVSLVSRSGTGPSHPSIQPVALDASNSGALTELTDSAQAIYNCASMPYSKWAKDWPPLASSILEAAAHSGAVLATASYLYCYAHPTSPMTEADSLAPSSVKGRLRVEMWQEALNAHQRGNVRITEVRGSDYLGPLVGLNGQMGDRAIPKLFRGKAAPYLGNPDALHSWTSLDDMASALIVAAADERAWGQAWHAPTAPPLTMSQLVSAFCRQAEIPDSGVKQIPRMVLKVMGKFNPDMGHLGELFYQFDNDFVVDSSHFSSTFGVAATPIEDTLDALVDHYRPV